MRRGGRGVGVCVWSVDRKQGRVALSLRQLPPDPWCLVAGRYEVGQLVEGSVTNVVSYGAFMRVAEGLEGLVHISELAEGNFLHPRNVVKEGDEVSAGQVVLKLEAMKMENDISTAVAGSVKEIAVSEGAEVSDGQLLLTVG